MGHPQIAQRVVSCGRCALGRGGTRIDPTISLLNVVIRGQFVGTRMPCWSYLYPWLVIDSDLHDTLDMSDSLFTAPTTRNTYLLL
jgi:hypothetical protein